MTAPRICCAGIGVDRTTLLANVAASAGGFRTLGIGPGDCVALLMRNSVAFVEITLAVGRVGGFAVPINWHFTTAEIAVLLEDCTPRVILVDAELVSALPSGWTERAHVIAVHGEPTPAMPEALTYAPWRDAAAPYRGEPQASPGSIVYTSGTTGRPKGVRRLPPTAGQQRAMQQVRAKLYRSSAEDRVLIPGPLYHAFPNQLATHAALHAAQVEIMARFDAEELLGIIERERITSIGLAPIMFIRLLRLPQAVRSRYDLSSLRWAIHAGGPCPQDVKRAMIDWWGPVIAEYYGGTETGPLTLCTSAEWLAHPGTCGKPVEGARIRIVDPSGGDAPSGEAGEIFGRLDPYPDFTYHNDPDKRRSVGLDDLVSLGDVGYLDADGYLYLCDRLRDMIVSGGVNIYPAEVEAALLALPGVEDCAVIGAPDEEFGEAVVAFVVSRGLEGAALRRDLRGQVAGFKIPRDFVMVPTLDRDASGKLRKHDLRTRYLASTRSEFGQVEERS